MLKIEQKANGSELIFALEGRLDTTTDTTTAPQLENELRKSLSGVESLIFEFEALEYISSAGLRVLLSSQKQMNKQGEMVIRNVRPEIMEIFDVTGFSDILTIE